MTCINIILEAADHVTASLQAEIIHDDDDECTPIDVVVVGRGGREALFAFGPELTAKMFQEWWRDRPDAPRVYREDLGLDVMVMPTRELSISFDDGEREGSMLCAGARLVRDGERVTDIVVQDDVDGSDLYSFGPELTAKIFDTARLCDTGVVALRPKGRPLFRKSKK